MSRRASVGARLVLLVAIALATGGCVTVWQGLGPQGPAAGSEGARRLASGPWKVGRRDVRLVDVSRATPANGKFAGAASRALETTVWFPRGAPGPLPLLVYCHGLMSGRLDGAYLGEHLASHGTIVVAADFPLSRGRAPGGATLQDLVHQPGDVSFLIDVLLGARGDALTEGSLDPVVGRVDAGRIGVAGLSLGGLTSTLVVFHPQLRDPRVRAGVSIAGPVFLFGPRFFRTTSAPFLMIAGTRDALVAYDSNAAVLLQRAPAAALVTLAGASHTGFAGISGPLFRFWPQPDQVGCWALRRGTHIASDADGLFAELGGEASGVVRPDPLPRPCEPPPRGRAMRPGRQQAITRLAVRAFLDAVFDDDEEARARGRRYLVSGLAADFEEVDYRGVGAAARAARASADRDR